MTAIYGVSSLIPPFVARTKKLHWVLADVDSLNVEKTIFWLRKALFSTWKPWISRTPHGYHMICYDAHTFFELERLMPRIPGLDLDWYRIGHKRGYWFLWTRTPVPAHPPVTYMKIEVPEGNMWLNTKPLDGLMKRLPAKK